MHTLVDNTGMDPELKGALQQACDRIARGVMPTMDERKAAATRLDGLRERNARLFGIQDVTLDAVRASRAAK